MASETDEAVGRRAWDLREGTGMSQAALAAAMTRRGHPWHQSTVHRVECGMQPLRVGELLGLAGIFGVLPSRLLGEHETRPAAERRAMEHALREQIAAEIAGRAAVA